MTAESNPTAVPGPRPVPAGKTGDCRRRKRQIIVLLLAYSLLYGGLCVFAAEIVEALTALAAVPFLVMAVMWCYWDARAREYKSFRVTAVGLVTLFPVVFALYLFRTRGLGAFKVLGQALAFVLAMLACMCLGAAFTSLAVVLIYQRA